MNPQPPRELISAHDRKKLRFVFVEGMCKWGGIFTVVLFAADYLKQFGFSLPPHLQALGYLAYTSLTFGAAYGLGMGLIVWCQDHKGSQ